MSQLNEPNIIWPLASSYNARGIIGFTNTLTNAYDQRKINAIYEPVINAASGAPTLYVAKRPGVISVGGAYGISTQAAYLVHHAAGSFGQATAAAAWVFSTVGNDTRVSSNTTTTTISSAVGAHPAYVDRTAISNTDNVVFQVRTPSNGAQRFWYMTSIGAATEIVDADFTALSPRGKAEHMDGFMFVFDNTAKAIYNLDVNSLSAMGASSYISKQIVQDDGQGLARLGNQILAFGNETVEVFRNAGVSEGSPLITVPGLFARIGLDNQIVAGYTHYYAVLWPRMYFVGRQAASPSLGAYAFDGEKFEKVSTQAIDKILTENSGSNYSVNKVLFSGKRAVAFALDLTTAATQRWLMFFPEWNEWFEWTSTVFTPVNNGDLFLGVGAAQNNLRRISYATANWQDNGSDFTWTYQFKIPSRGNHRQTMSMFGVVGDTAASASSLNVQFSDNDWVSLTAARVIDMTSLNKAIYRCGQHRRRGVRLTHTANLDIRLEKAVARVE